MHFQALQDEAALRNRLGERTRSSLGRGGAGPLYLPAPAHRRPRPPASAPLYYRQSRNIRPPHENRVRLLVDWVGRKRDHHRHGPRAPLQRPPSPRAPRLRPPSPRASLQRPPGPRAPLQLPRLPWWPRPRGGRPPPAARWAQGRPRPRPGHLLPGRQGLGGRGLGHLPQYRRPRLV
jgi:hypothetical protein